MAEAQPYYGQRYHGSEFLSAPQLMFPRSPCSTDWLFLYYSMDSSLGRAFLPLPRWFSLANPPFQEVIKSKHGDIRAIRARRDSESRTRTEAVAAEKETARVEKEQDRARREAEKKTARVQKEQDRARREAENVARRDARTADLAIRNERLAYVQQNADENGGSRDDGMEGGSRTSLAGSRLLPQEAEVTRLLFDCPSPRKLVWNRQQSKKSNMRRYTRPPSPSSPS
jgi:hypothetical protein